MMNSLEERLSKIRDASSKSNQKQNAVVLSAVEETLREQNTLPSPTAYFVALLSLLQQSIPSDPDAKINDELAIPITYILDIVTPHAPPALLKSKFADIIRHLAPAITHPDAGGALLRSSIGCLESLLTAQDGPSWSIPQREIGPRMALAGLINLALHSQPKVRKRAAEAVTKVLENPPPSPKLDHPASEMCASIALTSLVNLVGTVQAKKGQHDPRLIHSLHLVSAIAAATGWPSSKIEQLTEVLLEISKSNNEYLTLAVFNVFETMFAKLEDEVKSAKLPHIIEAISSLRPSKNDAQVLPPWIAAMARGYEVLAHVDPEKAFETLPTLFELAATFLESPAESIRTSSSQFLIALTVNCIPDSVIIDFKPKDAMVLDRLAQIVSELLSVRYQGAWMEVFDVLSVFFEALRWRGNPSMLNAVKVVGDLRGNEGFQGKKQADEVLGHAIRALGPEIVLRVLPLNLAAPQPGQPGRAWLLPILRDNVANTDMSHFIEELVPLSEVMFQRVLEHGDAEKTMEVKIYETIVQQVWAIFPGYCDTPLDLPEAFTESFAEMLANVLYKQVDLRPDVCKGLQNLVESNRIIAESEDEEMLALQRLTKNEAKKNIQLLSSYCSRMLAVLFNVYTATLPQFRHYILRTIDVFMSITSPQEITENFTKIVALLEDALPKSVALTQAEKQKRPKGQQEQPPMAHTLMDLLITISGYLPSESHSQLLTIFKAVLDKKDDPQLQKKSYKIIARLAESEAGNVTLKAQSVPLQAIFLESMESVSPPSRRDRLVAMAHIVEHLDPSDLHFIPSILSEVVISAKEVNEKARAAAFDLLVLMGKKMAAGGTVVNSKVPHMPDDAPSVQATLEEYFTMVAAGLAGSTPHMISASVTALTRILYEFKDQLSQEVITDMVSTMDLFLTSKNREIVRSVLGFVKVSVISLPRELMLPRLPSLCSNLMVWSHEHKTHFRAKVKHIIERMIRRFGFDIVEKNIPEEDKKLVNNIRKTKERKKRGKEAAAAAGDDDEETSRSERRKNRFESEYEQAIYGSESEDSGSEDSDTEMGGADSGRKGKKSKKGKGEMYIVEGDEDPLDLLDRKSLANISSTKPMKARQAKLKSKVKTNDQGKLILGDSDDEGGVSFRRGAGKDDMDVDMEADPGAGVNAYLEAVSGKDAYTRGQRGKVKFSQKGKNSVDDFDDEEDDDDRGSAKRNSGGSFQKGHERRGSSGGRGRGDRRGSVGGGTRGGRVQKNHGRGSMRGGGGGGRR